MRFDVVRWNRESSHRSTRVLDRTRWPDGSAVGRVAFEISCGGIEPAALGYAIKPATGSTIHEMPGRVTGGLQMVARIPTV